MAHLSGGKWQEITQRNWAWPLLPNGQRITIRISPFWTSQPYSFHLVKWTLCKQELKRELTYLLCKCSNCIIIFQVILYFCCLPASFFPSFPYFSFPPFLLPSFLPCFPSDFFLIISSWQHLALTQIGDSKYDATSANCFHCYCVVDFTRVNKAHYKYKIAGAQSRVTEPHHSTHTSAVQTVITCLLRGISSTLGHCSFRFPSTII